MKHLLTSTIIAVLIASLVAFGLVFSSPLRASQVNGTGYGYGYGYSYSPKKTNPVQVIPEDVISEQEPEILPLLETIEGSYQGAIIHAALVKRGIEVEHNSYWRDVHLSAIHYLGGDNMTEWQIDIEPVPDKES